ncbi:Transmembrane emp24 domain-containing protein eca [Babesia sp. Xinjiang]|uniref:Transmembrane emp24 domain-containing protein eca n=1 Tax=Babesia sp. Xinjiang TaxID=462227 RepID=UPI000A25BDF4|nr:Transmembrane emp24 domain-containing protein eca [Babesia sp. Xinjiang]ORM40294.1 Transmembrane emp24 domain-containing protein eca [Babesia sp. Xinjiang]
MKVALCFQTIIAAYAVGAAGFYFNIDYNDQRCFYETLPQMALLSINYELLNQEARSCVVRISDDQRKVLQNTNLKDVPTRGRVTYVAKEEGPYNVCIDCPGQLWYTAQMAKISLSIEIADGNDKYGRHAQYDVDKDTTAKKEEMKNLSEEVSKFAANIMNIKNHQRLENTTVRELHDTYKSMYNYVLYFYLVQFFIIAATAIFSVYHITKFFKAYRIV